MNENPTVERTPEPCAECGYPLAADQRYCLNCGRRRGEPRVDYVAYPEGGGGGMSTATEQVPVPAAPLASVSRDPSPVVAVVGIALLGLMLLVGVLIGRGDGSVGEQQAATPTVVQVGGEGKQVAADAPATSGGGADTAKDVKADKSGGGGGDDKIVTGPVGSGSGTTEDPTVADRDDLEALEGATGEEQQDASANLPDTIALPGKPPPTDNEEPGGGTGATVIK